MRGYRRHQLLLALCLVAYAATGAAARWTRPNGEIFPVFSWTLFLYVPGEVNDHEVEILSLRGEPLPEPLPFHEARGLFPGAGDVTAKFVVEHMGRAFAAGDEAGYREQRALFESRFLGARQAPVRYRLFRRRYDPLERWRTGRIRAREPLDEQTFVASAP